MAEPHLYRSSKALFRALTQQAKEMGVEPETAHTGFIFERFIARVVQVDDSWVLKGGGAMLTRVIDTRATSDLDFVARHCTMAELRSTLEEICAVDLGDGFTFTLESLRTDVEHEYDDGQMSSVTIAVTIFGAPRQKKLELDITFNVVMTRPPELVRRSSAPRPRGFDAPLIRLYPVVDHVADKVCATAQTYKNGASTRVRDLVDICVVALELDVDASELATAIAAEWQARRLDGPPSFNVPATFDATAYAGYAAQSRSCLQHAPTLSQGAALAGALLAPVLGAAPPAALVWRSASRSWEPA